MCRRIVRYCLNKKAPRFRNQSLPDNVKIAFDGDGKLEFVGKLEVGSGEWEVAVQIPTGFDIIGNPEDFYRNSQLKQIPVQPLKTFDSRR